MSATQSSSGSGVTLSSLSRTNYFTVEYSGKLLLIYICYFHVLNHFLLIYICKLHWNSPQLSRTMYFNVEYSGNFLLIYLCYFHVLSNLLLISICKLHWNFPHDVLRCRVLRGRLWGLLRRVLYHFYSSELQGL